ncbi:molybdopterin synthase catalytic subunit MoaE [Neptunicella marina]|uniref:Molybdopterin synthase catalytic subunit n=1 Tax=Neptunicella marina TaxID=2125989 RepID=A0A8J6IY02_9ALTE|nr:molybdopterin synthase catalytic subunit MoaE [Neptunicella marina]MBC3767396.1 molybdopterin synthase catalytic subunit MoaE [Neptunicella marina]
MISIQSQDFSLEDEYQALRTLENGATGAIVIFSGLVRDFNDNGDIQGLFIEHYPGMTEQAIAQIVERATLRWSLQKVRVIHRIGELKSNEQIVFVGIASQHRADAFAACEFIMDYLKNDVPLWKKELSNHNSQWVEAKTSDKQSLKRWNKS